MKACPQCGYTKPAAVKGSAGGKALAKSRTPLERAQAASHAAKKRWGRKG